MFSLLEGGRGTFSPRSFGGNYSARSARHKKLRHVGSLFFRAFREGEEFYPAEERNGDRCLAVPNGEEGPPSRRLSTVAGSPQSSCAFRAVGVTACRRLVCACARPNVRAQNIFLHYCDRNFSCAVAAPLKPNVPFTAARSLR